MKWYAETTEWAGATGPNHQYLLDDSKSRMYAYKPFGSQPAQKFKNPISISSRGRKFVLLPALQELLDQADLIEKATDRVWIVAGSKGNEYRVTEQAGTYYCTCSGFKFRGQCKHSEHIRETQHA